MKIHEHAALMARYNVWAHRRLYAALAALPEDDYRRPCGLFFGSIHRTLNHVLLVHRLWVGRLTAEPESFAGLDQELVADRRELERELIGQARAWAEVIATVPRERFEGTVQYVDTAGVARELPYAPLAHNVVNHATHHRGQISAALTRLGLPAPEMDYPYFLLEQRF